MSQELCYYSTSFDFKICLPSRKVSGLFEKRAPGLEHSHNTLSGQPGTPRNTPEDPDSPQNTLYILRKNRKIATKPTKLKYHQETINIDKYVLFFLLPHHWQERHFSVLTWHFASSLCEKRHTNLKKNFICFICNSKMDIGSDWRIHAKISDLKI